MDFLLVLTVAKTPKSVSISDIARKFHHRFGTIKTGYGGIKSQNFIFFLSVEIEINYFRSETTKTHHIGYCWELELNNVRKNDIGNRNYILRCGNERFESVLFQII